MCECIPNLREKIKPEIQKKHPTMSSFSFHTTLNGRAIIECSINLSTQRKQKTTFVVAEYCPFCGTRYS